MIDFINNHLPKLLAGDYELTIEQKIEAPSITNNNQFSTTYQFAVRGERFHLDPKEVVSVFPPPGSLGDHENVLPHIMLKRSTLPWERPLDQDNPDLPWLVLLVFDETEYSQVKKRTLPYVSLSGDVTAKFPLPTSEKGQIPKEQIRVIEVPKDLLQEVMPKREDLSWLAHVRETDQVAQAVIMAHRFGKKGNLSSVHLVSLENRFKPSGEFDYQEAANTDLIRLVSLHEWRYTCKEETKSFKGLLEHLNRQPSQLRLPSVTDAKTEAYLKKGYVSLPQRFREGSDGPAWYRGPLLPFQPTDTFTPHRAKNSDELLIYDQSSGMFAPGLAAAWELGRLIMLSNKKNSRELFVWKRTHAQRKAFHLQPNHQHLPIHDHQPDVQDLPPFPEKLKEWFKDLSLLKGVPFNYLVPDERMLPVESIRFFSLNMAWIHYLLDGAFSIGRTSDAQHQKDLAHLPHPASNPYSTVSGCLIRSDVIAGWPALLVDGYRQKASSNSPIADSEHCKLLRMERLSPQVLIVLFKGNVQTVDIHQKSEAMHHGFNVDESLNLYKKLRNSQGLVSDQTLTLSSGVWNNQAKGILAIGKSTDGLAANIEKLKGKLGFTDFTNAQFALSLVEGVQKVRFVRG